MQQINSEYATSLPLENEFQSTNVQVVPEFQFRYKSFKQERGKLEFEIIFKFQ